jgi:hypothetical protein
MVERCNLRQTRELNAPSGQSIACPDQDSTATIVMFTLALDNFCTLPADYESDRRKSVRDYGHAVPGGSVHFSSHVDPL